jgi:AraC-like DNA-binding protein
MARKRESTEKAQFRRLPELGNVELLKARYHRHTFDKHFHDGYAFGVVEEGALGFRYLDRDFVAGPGDINLAIPGETHNGFAATDLGWSYKMFYLPAELIKRAACDIADRDVGMPLFMQGVIKDPEMASKLRCLHNALLSSNISLLEAESSVVEVFARMVTRHSEDRRSPGAHDDSPKAVERAVDYLEAHYDENVSLESLSEAAGLSRYYFLRLFRKHTGLPPHTYLTQLRVQRAKSLLQAGRPILETALATGFTDQSHFNRRFKRLVGVTPGAYGNSVQD